MFKFMNQLSFYKNSALYLSFLFSVYICLTGSVYDKQMFNMIVSVQLTAN